MRSLLSFLFIFSLTFSNAFAQDQARIYECVQQRQNCADLCDTPATKCLNGCIQSQNPMDYGKLLACEKACRTPFDTCVDVCGDHFGVCLKAQAASEKGSG